MKLISKKLHQELTTSLDNKEVAVEAGVTTTGKKVFKYLMPCPFTCPKMFFASPMFLSQPKNLTAFSASLKTFVRAQKPILLDANHKMLVTATIRR